ncbi:hypothetical protein DQ240_22290 [Blastococcus sp. TF02A-26]|nr:hypothetical protein DQ240_22290 [Blastococcus sp. TF02A-26]
MRVVIDADGVLGPDAYEAGLVRLREGQLEVVASPAAHLPERRREVELILDESQLAARDEYVGLCSRAFGLPATPGVVSFISRGTDDDARGVLAGFGLDVPVVERFCEDDDEVVRVVLTREQASRVPEGRLHTALEAALNCEVRIVVDTGAAWAGSGAEGAP